MESLRAKPYFITLFCKYLWSTHLTSTTLDAQGKSDEHLVEIAPEKRPPQGTHNPGEQGISEHSKQFDCTVSVLK